jgi:phage terminase Nu1 subunit (DNA packaging protein)
MANDLPETVSAETLGQLLGLGAERIRQLAKNGIMEKLGHGKFKLASNVKAYVEFVQVKRKNQWDGDGSEEGENYEAHRARLTKAKADMAEMQAAVLKGTVHEAKAVEAVWTDHLLACRAKLLSLPKKYAPRVHTLERLASVEAELETGVMEALNELAAYDPALVTDRYVSAHRQELDAAAEMDDVTMERLDPKAKS